MPNNIYGINYEENFGSPEGNTGRGAGRINIGGAGAGVALGIGEQLMNQAFAGINQKRQLKGMEKAHQMQNRYALEMWEKTGYGAQKKQMQEAGINPALLYGMSGGGGQTTQSSATDTPTATGQAASLTAPVMGMLNAQLLESQVEVNKSIANKNNTDAGYTGGAQTDNTKQQTEESKMRTAGQKIANQLSDLNWNIAKDSQWYTKDNKYQEWRQNQERTRQEMAKANVSEKVQDELIAQEELRTIGMTIENKAKEKGIELTDAQIDNLEGMLKVAYQNAESQGIISRVAAAGQMTNADRLAWDKEMKDVSESTKIGVDLVGNVATGIIFGKMLKGNQRIGKPIEGINPNRWKKAY